MTRLTAALLMSCTALAACGGGAPIEPPIPENAEEAASIVAAARACDAADFADWPEADIGRPEFSEDITERERNALLSALYIERVSARPCVYTLPSGLAFQVNRAVEEGESPEPGRLISAHYHGDFPNGEMFDSSYERGEPLCAPSNVFIRGWNEALTHMRVGEEWELFIPWEMAYGANGRAPAIPPAQALHFRMELLDMPENC